MTLIVSNMDMIAFYLGAAILCGLGILCLRNTSPYTRAGGAKFEKRGKRKLIGYILLVVAAMSLVLGIIAQVANTP